MIKRERHASPFLFCVCGSVAAAAKNDQSNDDDPAAVVITEYVTQAVVHSEILLIA
jgi:hypothetical protein